MAYYTESIEILENYWEGLVVSLRATVFDKIAESLCAMERDLEASPHGSAQWQSLTMRCEEGVQLADEISRLAAERKDVPAMPTNIPLRTVPHCTREGLEFAAYQGFVRCKDGKLFTGDRPY